MLKAIAVLSMLLIFLGAVFAQDPKPAQQVEHFKQVTGHWVNTEQQRDTPDSQWEDLSSEWDIRIMPGGFFVEIPGSMTFKDGRVVSWVEVVGYDPVLDTTFDYWFNSDGSRGEATSRWDGQTLNGTGRETSADGTQLTLRCEWKHNSDFTSVEGACERLTDGKWWTFRRVQGKKAD